MRKLLFFWVFSVIIIIAWRNISLIFSILNLLSWRIGNFRLSELPDRVYAHVFSDMKKGPSFSIDFLRTIIFYILTLKLEFVVHALSTAFKGLLFYFLKNELSLLLMIAAVNFENDLNRGTLESFHGDLILNFCTIITIIIFPLEFSLILILFESTDLSEGRLTCPWEIIIWDDFKLRVDRPLFLVDERTLEFLQRDSHCLVLLDIYL
jgi:hypothetical protein